MLLLPRHNRTNTLSSMRVRSAVRRLCKGTSPFARHSPFSFLQSFLFFSLLFSSLYSLSFLFLRACSTFFYFLTFFLFSLNPFLTPWFPFHVHPFPILFLLANRLPCCQATKATFCHLQTKSTSQAEARFPYKYNRQHLSLL